LATSWAIRDEKSSPNALIFLQEDRKDGRAREGILGFALPPATGWGSAPSASRAPQARRTQKLSPSDLPIFL
jgi:hypothetical protein